MRKIILNLAITLDGYIEGPNGEYDWCFTDQDYGMTPFLAQTDAIFFGRKSFELMRREDPGAFKDKKHYVFTRSQSYKAGNATIMRGDIKSEVNKIVQSAGKDIWLFGGAELTAAFLELNLIDEFMLAVHPILLGGGKPLFQDTGQQIELQMTDCKTYSSGLVQLFYSVLKRG